MCFWFIDYLFFWEYILIMMNFNFELSGNHLLELDNFIVANKSDIDDSQASCQRRYTLERLQALRPILQESLENTQHIAAIIRPTMEKRYLAEWKAYVKASIPTVNGIPLDQYWGDDVFWGQIFRNTQELSPEDAALFDSFKRVADSMANYMDISLEKFDEIIAEHESSVARIEDFCGVLTS